MNYRNTKSRPQLERADIFATMKSLSTLSFTVLTPLFLLLVNLANRSSYSGSVQAALLPGIPPPNVPPELVEEYFKLLNECYNGGPNAVRCLNLR